MHWKLLVITIMIILTESKIVVKLYHHGCCNSFKLSIMGTIEQLKCPDLSSVLSNLKDMLLSILLCYCLKNLQDVLTSEY